MGNSNSIGNSLSSASHSGGGGGGDGDGRTTSDSLRQALMPTFERLYQHVPESLSFRQQVNLEEFSDYLKIVKKPMDLSKIKKKLDAGKYSDPLEYRDDVRLMINNARNYYENHEGPHGDTDLHHRKISRDYEYSKTLSKVFAEEMPPVLKRLGYSDEQP